MIPFATMEVSATSKSHKHVYYAKKDDYNCISTTKVGSSITGGWFRKSGVQEVYANESASNIAGKSFSTKRTVSFNIPLGTLQNILKAKLGCSVSWEKGVYSATAKNSARNSRDNKARYIAFCMQNRYQKYKMKYRVTHKKYCSKCNKWITQSVKTKTAYAYKKIGTNSAFFYSDKKSNLTSEVKQCLYKDGIMYESFEKEKRGYLHKNGKILTGAANKGNQNYNAFSNIKYWH